MDRGNAVGFGTAKVEFLSPGNFIIEDPEAMLIDGAINLVSDISEDKPLALVTAEIDPMRPEEFIFTDPERIFDIDGAVELDPGVPEEKALALVTVKIELIFP